MEQEIYNLRSKSLVQSPKVLAIGSSTGGLKALIKLFSSLNDCIIDIPILITQHLPQNFDSSFADKISSAGSISCKVVQDGDIVENGKAYIAPAGFHMLVKEQGNQKVIKLEDSPPINFCRPAVDPMLESIAEVYGKNVFCLILTGIGHDGRKGCRKIVEKGGTVIAQDKETSVVWGMPAAVAEAGLCTQILPLDDMPEFLKDYSYGKIR